MDCFGDTEELSIFEAKVVSEILNFKWETSSGIIHKLGSMNHILYLVVFSVFVNEFYVYNGLKEYHTILFFVQILNLMYPCLYDMNQLKKQGFTIYFSDKWNWADQVHIWGGFLNIYLHSIDHPSEEMVTNRKVLLIILCFIMLIKTFFFMRLYQSMSELVMMMLQVMVDLRAFLCFYFILIWICGL